MKKSSLAIVVPVFAEGKNLPTLYDGLQKVVAGIEDVTWTYIFVNDGSPDNSLNILKAMAMEDSSITVLDLSRNFGKEIALTAGAHEAQGVDGIICMDADLQHPPELIPQLVDEWRNGADIVSTIRKDTENESVVRKLGSRSYYWIMSKISGLDMVSQTTDYRLYDRKILDVFLTFTERERMFRGIMDWMGFNKVYVEFSAPERFEGEPGYSYGRLFALAIGSITSFSLWPLKITGVLGLIISLVSGLLLIWMLFVYWFQSEVVYSPLAIFVVANTFLVGVVLMALGMIALYVGQIHTEVVNRPLYIVNERVSGREETRI